MGNIETHFLKNCTLDPSTWVVGENTVNIIANKGFRFPSNAKVFIEDDWGNIISNTISFNSDRTIITVIFKVGSSVETISIDANASEVYTPIVLDITGLTNCIVNTTSLIVGDNDLILTAINNKKFAPNYKPTLEDDYGNMITPKNIMYSDDNKIINFTISITKYNDPTYITAVANVDDVPPVESFTVTNNLVKCTNSNPSIVVNKGDIFSFTLTADLGYIFNTPIEVHNGDVITNYSNFTDDNTKCIITINNVTGNIIINGTAVEKPKTLGTFANIYLVNDDILTALSKERFHPVGDQFTDFGQFIYNLYETPFIIPSDVQYTDTNILMGNMVANTVATPISKYLLTYSLGKIIIPEKYKNSFDYTNVGCKLYTPFSNAIDIDVMYVMGCTISIDYLVDLYSGVATIQISSTFTNEVIKTINSNVSNKIPFLIQWQQGTNVGTITDVNNSIINTCYLEISRNIPCNIENNPFGSECMELSPLAVGMGYVELQDIILNIPKITPNELQEIKALLNSGIII